MNSEAYELSRQLAEVTKPVTLTEIADAIIASAQCDENGELTPEACELLDQLKLTLERKVEGYHIAYNHLTSEAAMNKELCAVYEARARAKKNAAERLRTRLFDELQRIGMTEVRAPTCKARIEYAPATVVIDDGMQIDALPEDCIVTNKCADKRKLIELLKSGAEVKGCKLVRAPYLRFR